MLPFGYASGRPLLHFEQAFELFEREHIVTCTTRLGGVHEEREREIPQAQGVYLAFTLS